MSETDAEIVDHLSERILLQKAKRNLLIMLCNADTIMMIGDPLKIANAYSTLDFIDKQGQLIPLPLANKANG